MAHKQQIQLTATKEWARHLRNFWKKRFWKQERRAVKESLVQSNDTYNQKTY